MSAATCPHLPREAATPIAALRLRQIIKAGSNGKRKLSELIRLGRYLGLPAK
jgi:hypothetical protein